MSDGQPALRRELQLWHLVLFNVSAVAGIRWLAAAARFPQEGGFYVWTKRAFGDWHGFLAAWVYFVSNILYFPTLLLSGVAMASFLFGESGVKYSENALYAIPA